jgi:histone-lysine N-methyltransferase ASH1L
MVKWVVAGKPRMALFAGDRPIMTGDELTYDYNFDPFSAKNVQECRCGSSNCRGILGPRPKDKGKNPAGAGASLKGTGLKRAKSAVKAGKRKLKEFLGGEEDEKNSKSSIKKRKIASPKMKRSMSVKALKAVKGVKRSISKTIVSSTSKRAVVVKKRSKTTTLKTYGKKQTTLSSRNSSLTIVAADDNVPIKVKVKGKKPGPKASPKTTPKKGPAKKASSPGGRRVSGAKKEAKKNVVRSMKSRLGGNRGTSQSTIRVISVAGEQE